MANQRVLFIGGTGVISSACAAAALERGMDVTLLNRGRSDTHAPADGAEVVTADVRDAAAVRDALGDREFDVVADFLSFTPRPRAAAARPVRRPDRAVRLHRSASAYQTPPSRLPVTESTPLRNPFWQYSRDKIACEDLLVAAYRETGLPMTIVRPSHTYDHTLLPFEGGWTVVDRMRRGKEVVVHGDGSSLWTLTHHTDFAARVRRAARAARGARRGLPHHRPTSPRRWDRIYQAVAEAAGVEPRLVHVPSDAIAAEDDELGASLLGDKAHSMVFDNSKVKALVPGWAAPGPLPAGRPGDRRLARRRPGPPARRPRARRPPRPARRALPHQRRLRGAQPGRLGSRPWTGSR